MPSCEILSLNVTPLDLVVLAASRGHSDKIMDQAKWSSLWLLVLLAHSKLGSFIERWDVAGYTVGWTQPWPGFPGEASASFRSHEEPQRYLGEMKKI